MNKICFREEAKDWNEALPIGNGFLGAMVFGKTGTERLQINEDSVWTGSFMERVNPDARENYTKSSRTLIKWRNRTGRTSRRAKYVCNISAYATLSDTRRCLDRFFISREAKQSSKRIKGAFKRSA